MAAAAARPLVTVQALDSDMATDSPTTLPIVKMRDLESLVHSSEKAIGKENIVQSSFDNVEMSQTTKVPLTVGMDVSKEEQDGRSVLGSPGLLDLNKIVGFGEKLSKDKELLSEKQEREQRGNIVNSKGVNVDLNAEDDTSSVNVERVSFQKEHGHFKSKDLSQSGISTGPSKEKDPMTIWTEMKRNGFISSAHGGIPVPKKRGRKSKNEVLEQKMELAKREQINRFTKIAAPSGLLNDLNPGIINHVRNRKQVHSIIEALVTEKHENRSKQEAHRMSGGIDMTKRDLECVNEDGTFHGSAGGRQARKSHTTKNDSSWILEGKDCDRDTYSVEKAGLKDCISNASHVTKDDNLSLKLSSSMKASMSSTSLSNEESSNVTAVSSLSLKAATVASQWLELLHQDIKGRLSTLRRSRRRVRSVITTELPFLMSKEFADNQIHILKTSSMEVMRSISGIKPPLSSQEICESISSQAAFDRTSGLVVVQTENYGIQFYNLFGNRGLYEVQVCERNYQPVDEVTVVVTMVELSIDGSMMGTVKVKLPEEGIGGLICLKFWDLYSDTKRFSMSTLIYEPHRDAHISAIVFHPTRHMAVSTSYGGDFKIWGCREETQHKDQTLQNFSWMCHAVGSYKNKAMRAAAFSADGSVLAVAADTVITLWDPDKNELIVVVGETPSPIERLSFVGKSEYLLSASHGSTPQLSVWSMSKLAASWSYGLQIEVVSCALDLSYFAILGLLPKSNESLLKGDGIILVFNATDPIPVASWSVTKAKGGSVAFLKGNPSQLADGKSSQTLLAYLNGDRKYVLFDPFDKEARELNMTKNDDFVGVEENGQFGYTSIYGELPKFDLKRNKTSSVYSAASNRPWETIFSGSSHMLPPLSKLCSEFLESLLEKRTSIVE